MNDLEMMKGTGNLLDYLVIATLDGFKLGVKPIFDSNKGKTFVGLRVRLSPDMSNPVPQIGIETTMVSLYPNIQWSSKSAKRLSFVGGAVVNIKQNNIPALHEWFTNSAIPVELFKHLQGLFPNTELMLSSLFVDFFTNKFLEKYKLPDPVEQTGATIFNMLDYKKALYDSSSDDETTPKPDDDIDYDEDGEK